jgi:hypothetical protein
MWRRRPSTTRSAIRIEVFRSRNVFVTRGASSRACATAGNATKPPDARTAMRIFTGLPRGSDSIVGVREGRPPTSVEKHYRQDVCSAERGRGSLDGASALAYTVCALIWPT